MARLGRTPRHAVRRMAQLVTAAGGRLLGIVATGAKPAPGDLTVAYGESRETDQQPSGAIKPKLRMR